MDEGIPSEQEPKKEPGILSKKVENHHWVLTICWADGEISETHFPERGLMIVDPKTQKELGHMTAERVEALIRQEAPLLRREEFSLAKSFHNK